MELTLAGKGEVGEGAGPGRVNPAGKGLRRQLTVDASGGCLLGRRARESITGEVSAASGDGLRQPARSRVRTRPGRARGLRRLTDSFRLAFTASMPVAWG